MSYEPFTLKAKLLRGVSIEPYGLDLAGILASRYWRKRKAAILEENLPNYVDSMKNQPEDFDLPLDMCSEGEDWHWMATCAIYEKEDRFPQSETMYYKVVNDAWAGRAANRPLPYYNTKSGAYRDVMGSARIMLTGEVKWYGVGDPEAIWNLIKDIRCIGKRRSKGEGRVIKWEIETGQAIDDKWQWGHCGPDDKIHRPIPVECAHRLGLDFTLDWFAIRPPSWNPDRLYELAVHKDREVYFPEEWEL